MLRKIIKIDEDKCNGCGLCVTACHEGAIVMADGKARLLRDDYCDGLGDCLPACPTGAITFEMREAAAYDEAAVLANMRKKSAGGPLPGGCPGSRAMLNELKPQRALIVSDGGAEAPSRPSRLRQWPVQIKLAPVNAPYFAGASLLIAADCTAFACADLHERLMRDRITLIGCPKLDQADYAEKLAEIIKHNDIKSIKVARMEVPCCAGLVHMAERALRESGKAVPLEIVTITTDGQIIPEGARGVPPGCAAG